MTTPPLPIRDPIDWQSPEFTQEESLFAEIKRQFDLCDDCRRCSDLCAAFSTLFERIDDSSSVSIEGLMESDYWQVVGHCYLCDRCSTPPQCPYLPPHEHHLDFAHLMLRAKAVQFKQGRTPQRDLILTSVDRIGSLATLPLVATLVNVANQLKPVRRLLEFVLSVHHQAPLPEYHRATLRQRLKGHDSTQLAEPAGKTTGQVALFTTCWINYHNPTVGEDLVAVFEHNRIPVATPPQEVCCGMSKFEIGDLEAVARAKEINIPVLAQLVDEGWDLTALHPSCVLMFKQKLPLLFPGDPEVLKVKNAFYDPFEYLMLRHAAGKLKTDFQQPLGQVIYQAACHQRAQQIGPKSQEVLALVPQTTVERVDRCSGHGNHYAVQLECYAASMQIVKPVAEQVRKAGADYLGSDCILAGRHIAQTANPNQPAEHPISLLRRAYGIERVGMDQN